YKQQLGVDEFEQMPTRRFTPSQLRAPNGTPVNVGWCSPGVIVYKAIAHRDDETFLCGAISDHGKVDRLLSRMMDQAESIDDQYVDRTIEAAISKDIQTLSIHGALDLITKYDPGWAESFLKAPRSVVGSVADIVIPGAGEAIQDISAKDVVHAVGDFLESTV